MRLVVTGDISPGNIHHIFWYQPLLKRFPDLQYYDYARDADRKGQRQLNNDYLDVIRRGPVELLVESIHGGIIHPSTLAKRLPHVDLAIHFFNDDEWRFDIFSRFICQYYHLVTTNNPYRVEDYAAFAKPAVFVQYACNQDVCRRLGLPKRYDVTFIGQPHSDRHRTVSALRRAGIPIRVFGAGWDRHPELRKLWGGYLSSEEVVQVTNQSRICLSFLAASTGDRMAIKARLFEINGCGTFQLCSDFEEVARYYRIGKEIQVFRDLDDLVEKVWYYLAHEEEREAIAHAGYERTLREHTWEARYDHLFREIERLKPQIPRTPQPIISTKRVAVFYLARPGRVTPATVESLNAQTLPNLEVMLVSERQPRGAEALRRPWRLILPSDLESAKVEAQFIAFIEDGEEWEPEKLQFQAFALEQDAAKGIEVNFAQWGVFRNQGEPEFLTHYLRGLQTERLDALAPVGVVSSSLLVTADLFCRQQPLLARLLLRHDRAFAEQHFRDRAIYSHIELGVPLARLPEARLWEMIASLPRGQRYLWINSCLRYRSKHYLPDLLRRLRLGRAWIMLRAYLLRRPRSARGAEGMLP